MTTASIADTAAADRPAVSRWLPSMIALAAIWGCSFVFIAVGLRELHPVYVALGRVAAGAITILVVLAIRREALPKSRRLWAHFAVLGVVGMALPWTLFGYGEQRIPSLLAGIWNGTTPLLVLPIAVMVFRTEKFTAQRVIGLALGFVGMLVVLGAWQVDGGELAGQLMCFAAAACYGLAIPYQKKFITGHAASGFAITAGLLLSATVELAVLAPFVAGGAPPAPWDLSLKVFASVVALGALGSGIAFVLNTHNLRTIGASAASMVTYLIPVFAIIVGVLLLDEHLTWFQPVGAVIVLLGVAVSQGAFRKSR